MTNIVPVQQHQNNAISMSGQEPSAGLEKIAQSREIAEVQASILMARQFPRNQIFARDNILRECARPKLAEGALYSYPKGGQTVQGPSIRLAEVLARAWGNVDFGFREINQEPGKSTIECYAWDKETNTRQVKTFIVEHKRHTRAGSYPIKDPREIYELVANQAARRLRACILGVIPGDIIDEAVEECAKTLSANVDVTPDGVKKLIEAFSKIDVSKEMIEDRIGRRADAILPAQIVQLRGIYKSIEDGQSAVKEWFREPHKEAKPNTKQDQIEDLKK